MSSPFFKDLLSRPRPPNDELVDGLPVVQFPEGSGLLNGLISLLYPASPVVPSFYEKVFALLAACQKYDMESIQPYIRAEVKRGMFPAPAETESFCAYAIASSMSLIPEMEDAARLTLGCPMTFESRRRITVVQRTGTVRPGSVSQTWYSRQISGVIQRRCVVYWVRISYVFYVISRFGFF